MSQLIAVDIGNSAIKIGITDPDNDFECHRFDHPADLNNQLLGHRNLFWSVCSVNQSKCTDLQEWLKAHRPNDKLHIISESDVPIISNVDDRSQVGRDRLVGAWMAYQSHQHLFQGRDLVVVDAGTAVTIDLVDKHGVFQGGVIFPGAAATLTSLAKRTDALPDLSKIEFDLRKIIDQPIGKNTRDAILSGVIHSQLSSVTEIAKQLSCEAGIVATGGQIDFLRQHLPSSWKFNDCLILQGAKEIGKLILE